MKYLIVECKALGDQWECDADRTPLRIVDDYAEFNKYGYEIYKILPNGDLDLIKYYED